MKQLILLAAISLAFTFPGLPAPAAQESPPLWFIVFEEKFAPTNRTQFMRAQKKAVDSWKELHSKIPVYAWQNDDNTLYRVIPILSFASIDTLYLKMEQVSDFMKASNRGVEEKPVSQSISGSVIMWVPELSHHQCAEFSKHSDKSYSEWMFFYLHSDQEQEAEEALRKFRDYYIENKLDYPWDTFRVLLGNDTPAIISLFRAESPAAMQAKGKRIWKKHGDRLEKLWDDVVQHSRKIENKTGWFNPSLSNMPAQVIELEEEVAGGGLLP